MPEQARFWSLLQAETSSEHPLVLDLSRFIAAATLVLILVVGGCSSENDTGSEALALADTSTSLSVEGLEYQRMPDGSRVLSGLLVNATDRHVRNAQVQVSLYDELNQAVGNVSIPISDIDANSEKAFRFSVDRSDVAGARVRSILAAR
jgi:hypothetical protein